MIDEKSTNARTGRTKSQARLLIGLSFMPPLP
jgi:hypothetical protein